MINLMSCQKSKAENLTQGKFSLCLSLIIFFFFISLSLLREVWFSHFILSIDVFSYQYFQEFVVLPHKLKVSERRLNYQACQGLNM